VLDEVEDPEKRAAALGQLVGKFAQLRREESNAIRAQVTQERWDREKPRPEDDEINLDTPRRAYMLHRRYIEKYSKPEHRAEFLAAMELDPTESE